MRSTVDGSRGHTASAVDPSSEVAFEEKLFNTPVVVTWWYNNGHEKYNGGFIGALVWTLRLHFRPKGCGRQR